MIAPRHHDSAKSKGSYCLACVNEPLGKGPWPPLEPQGSLFVRGRWSYEQQVYNQALRMTGNSTDAMDVMQDVFLAVYRNLPNYRAEGVFPAWLSRIAANRCLDFLRQRQRQPESSDIDLDSLSSSGGPEQALGSSQRNKAIMLLLGVLSAEQRLVVELKFFGQHTFEEIAQLLGISSNTAKTRLYAALDKLKSQKEVSHAI